MARSAAGPALSFAPAKEYVTSSTFRKGRVIFQKPKFGAVLRKGGKVNLVVSRGRKG